MVSRKHVRNVSRNIRPCCGDGSMRGLTPRYVLTASHYNRGGFSVFSLPEDCFAEITKVSLATFRELPRAKRETTVR